MIMRSRDVPGHDLGSRRVASSPGRESRRWERPIATHARSTARSSTAAPTGAGKTSNLAFIQRKLKREHRGELEAPGHTRRCHRLRDAARRSSARCAATRPRSRSRPCPARPQAAALRRQILENVDGHRVRRRPAARSPRRDRRRAGRAAPSTSTSYGRKLEDVPLVVQYNHRDQADENAVERLHRLSSASRARCFEARADEGTGVLQTLTTLSKLVLGRAAQDARRGRRAAARSTPAKPRARGDLESSRSSPPTASGALDGDGRCRRRAPRRASRSRAPGPVDGGGSEIRIPVRLIDEATRPTSGDRRPHRDRLAVGERAACASASPSSDTRTKGSP